MSEVQARATAGEPSAAMPALWSALDAAATPASTLIMLAALVRTLSASDYGILVIALAASGLSMAINPAIAATTTKFVSQRSGQRELQNQTIAGVITVSLLTVIAIDLALLLATAVFQAPLSLWVFGAAAHTRQLGPILLLAVLAISVQQIETVLSAAIRGLERFSRQALIELVSKSVLTAGVVLAAWYIKTVEAILIAQCGVFLASTLVRAMALRRLLPGKRLFDLSGSAEAAELFKYGGWMWLTALAGVAYTSVDRIMVGRTLGAVAAGQYNIYVQITQLIHFIPSSLFAFSLPTFSRRAAEAGSGGGRIAGMYGSYLLSISMTGMGIAAILALSWPVVLRILVGQGDAGSVYGSPALLMANFLLLACCIAPYYLLLALGDARTMAVISSTSMLAALLLMAVLIPRFGMEGAALARMAYGIGMLTALQRARQLLKRA
jgi:O-antigen/teichoic acid export membrane protein